MKDKPYLSLQLRTFASEEPESWSPVIDQAVAADRAGIGKVVVSDHVVFGENLDAYADPTLGGLSGGKQPTGPDGPRHGGECQPLTWQPRRSPWRSNYLDLK